MIGSKHASFYDLHTTFNDYSIIYIHKLYRMIPTFLTRIYQQLEVRNDRDRDNTVLSLQ